MPSRECLKPASAPAKGLAGIFEEESDPPQRVRRLLGSIAPRRVWVFITFPGGFWAAGKE
jgi:hypothetical protein